MRSNRPTRALDLGPLQPVVGSPQLSPRKAGARGAPPVPRPASPGSRAAVVHEVHSPQPEAAPALGRRGQAEGPQAAVDPRGRSAGLVHVREWIPGVVGKLLLSRRKARSHN